MAARKGAPEGGANGKEVSAAVSEHSRRLVGAARELAATAAQMAAGGGQREKAAKEAAREAIGDALRSGSVALSLLKGDCRRALEGQIGAAAGGAETRQKIDVRALSVRASAYENRNLESVIASCRNACETCDAKILELGDLMPGPPAAEARKIEEAHRADGGADADAKIAHEKLAWRLGEERRARAAAMERLGSKRQQLDELRSKVHKRRKWLLTIEEDAKAFVAGSRAFQEKICKGGAGEEEALFAEGDAAALAPPVPDAAKRLPGPLYVAYCQLASARSAEGLEIEVFASCDADAAGAVAATVDDGAEKRLYEASEAYFTLRISRGGGELFGVVFRYLPRLQVVVAETERGEHNALLRRLFRDDPGTETPNMANLALQDGQFSFDPRASARPYKWAQRVAGIDLVADRGEAAGNDDVEMEGEEEEEEGAGKAPEAVEGDMQRAFRENRAVKLVVALVRRFETQRTLK